MRAPASAFHLFTGRLKGLTLDAEAGLRDADAPAVLRLLGQGAPIDDLLDIGTGTGRLLEILAPRVKRGLGVDMSRDMLSIARSNLERAGIKHCQVRQADMYALPLDSSSVDAAVTAWKRPAC